MYIQNNKKKTKQQTLYDIFRMDFAFASNYIVNIAVFFIEKTIDSIMTCMTISGYLRIFI